MSDHREDWQVLIGQLEERQARAEAMGGPDKVARQHQRGRLTARERLALLFDADAFNEIGALAGGSHPGGQPPLAGDGVVGGTGRIHGRTVVALAEDFTVKGGSIGHANAAVADAISRQSHTLITCPGIFYNDQRAAFLEKLTSLAPNGLGRAFLCNSGAEAAEGALKLARLATGRSGKSWCHAWK